MRTATRLDYNTRMAKVIDQIIRAKMGPIGVAELAEELGFSRFHLTRFFLALTGESLSDFLRRIQLERVAYLLSHSDTSVQQLALVSGYSSGESLTRAFRLAYGVPPSEYRQRQNPPWKIECPSDLHWVPELGLSAALVENTRFDVKVVSVKPIFVAAIHVVRSYRHLDQSFRDLADVLEKSGLQPPEAQYVTIYHDSMWTIPESSQMRADVGYVIEEGSELPPGLKLVKIPPGKYASTARYVARTERNDAWVHMDAFWSPKRLPDVKEFSFDLYPTFPLPFDKVQTKLFARVGR